MATANNTRFPDLKTRLAALDCELLEDDSEIAERYYILDRRVGKLVSVGQSIEDTYDWCDDQAAEEADAVRAAIAGDAEADTPSEALRRAAAQAVSSYRCEALNLPDKPLREAIDELEAVLDGATDTAETNDAEASRGVERLADRIIAGETVHLSADDVIDNARINAQQRAYEVGGLVKAAHALCKQFDEDDGLEEVLEAARSKIRELCDSLDSVNFAVPTGR